MPHEIAVIAFPGISPFHLSVPSVVFGNAALTGPAGPRYRLVVCAEAPGALPTEAGYDVHVARGLEALAVADTVVVPSWHVATAPSPRLLDALRAAHSRGARVVGLCLGAFPVAEAGLVDGRDVSTHWAYADALQARRLAARVNPDALWCDHGDVVTSAGVAAALDCCLHLVRQDLGALVATQVARSLVLAPHRDGGQAQFVPVPVAPQASRDPVAAAMTWALARLGEGVDLDEWSGAVALSRRTFTRRFRELTGTSPQRWLLHQRLLRAKELLESTDATVEAVAAAVGFTTSASLRAHFAERFGTSPARHRRTFAG